MGMSVKDLSHNPKNPRKISDARLEQLRKALHEFGDLGGFVYNRSTRQLVGGHQRSKVFDRDADITIEQRYKKPTRTGTVAEGFVLLDGERHKYREVIWDPSKEKAAALAANGNAGDWDLDIVRDWMRDLDNDAIDLDLTMFDDLDRKKLFAGLDESPKKEKKSRTASEDVRSVPLVFTAEGLEEFNELVEYFQKQLQISSITDTLLEVLRSAREAED